MKLKNPKPTPLIHWISAKTASREREVQDVSETRLEDLVGCTGYQGPAKSLDEMEAGIARGARQLARPATPD